MDGNELKERRKGLELTQDSLAKTLGVSTNTVARWERDEVPIPPYLGLAFNDLEAQHKKKRRKPKEII